VETQRFDLQEKTKQVKEETKKLDEELDSL